MPRIKSLLIRVEIDEAQKAHNSQDSGGADRQASSAAGAGETADARLRRDDDESPTTDGCGRFGFEPGAFAFADAGAHGDR